MIAKIAAFIDFQGTLGGSGIDDIKPFDFYNFSIEAIKLLNDSNVLVIGITNQSNISRGKLFMNEYMQKVQQLKDELSKHQAHFDAVYCCPHTVKDNCICKKPLTGMIDMAKKDFDIQLNKSYVIGDMGKNDMILAKNIGAKGILVLTGVGKGSLNEFRNTWEDVEANHITENVLEAAKWIVEDINT